MASALNSVLYAGAAVVLFVLLLECCCRRQVNQYRQTPQIITLNVMNPGPNPATTPCTTAPPLSPTVVMIRPTLPIYPIPVPPHQSAVAAVNSSIETPPPSYEQVMALNQGRGQLPLPGKHG